MHHAPRRAFVAVPVALALLATVAPAAQARTRAITCEAGYQWTKSTAGFIPRFRDSAENASSTTLQRTFTVTKSRSFDRQVTKGLESEVGGGFAGLQASVKGQFSEQVVSHVGIERGFKEQIDIKPFTRVVYRRGVNVRRYTGVLLAPNQGPAGPTGPPPPGLPAGCALRQVKKIYATIPTFAGTKISESRLRRP